MEAESRAYAQAKVYRRTSAIIDHGGGRNYVVDFFRVEGGKRQDYVYHGAAKTCDVLDLKLRPAPSEKLYDFGNVRAADGSCTWRAAWKCGANMTCVAWNVGQPGERVLVADGWGQRDWKNSDIGATIPYVVRRCEGGGLKTFVSVFEAHTGESPLVRSVKLLEPSGALVVETSLGRDYVTSHAETGTLDIPVAAGTKRITAHFAVAAVQDDRVVWTLEEPRKPSPASTGR
jgi:hypothetical protein